MQPPEQTLPAAVLEQIDSLCVTTSLPQLVVLGEGRMLALYLALTEKRGTLEVATVNRVPVPEEPDEDLGGENDPSLGAPLDQRSLVARRASLDVGKTGLVTVPVRCGRRQACEGRIMLRVVLPAAAKGGQRQAARPGGARAVLVFRAAPRGGRAVTQRRIVTLPRAGVATSG